MLKIIHILTQWNSLTPNRSEEVFVDGLYVKWKGYDHSFNTWIDKKDLIE